MRDYSRREALAASLLGTISLGLPGRVWAGGDPRPSKAEAEGGPFELPPSTPSAVTGLVPRFVLRKPGPEETSGWIGGTPGDAMLEVWVRNDTGAPQDLQHDPQQGYSASATATHGGVVLRSAMAIAEMSRMMPRPVWVAVAAASETQVLTQRLTPPDGVDLAALDLEVSVLLQLRDGRLTLRGQHVRLQADLG